MEKTITKEASSEVSIIDEELYERLYGMFGSSDEGDHKMGQLILNKQDVQKSIYYIWKLARKYSSRLVNLRTKDSRAFRDATNLFTLAYARETEFGNYLIKRGWMTPEIFGKIKGVIKDDIHTNTRSDKFYEFSIELKEENKHLDPDDELTKVSDLWTD